MNRPAQQLPEHMRPLTDQEAFTFACHPGVPCFTDCCRDLELALSPYDVLRLSRELGIASREFLDRYALIERDADDAFPQVYLGMVDDGQAHCPFVTPEGCRVYPGRPAACRTYPLGRGAWLDSEGSAQAFYVLQREAHCLGFAEPVAQGVAEWISGQGLTEYYQANDLLLPLLHHAKVKTGGKLSPEQQHLFLTTLYQLEDFRASHQKFRDLPDPELLSCAVRWLIRQFFGKRGAPS